VTLKRGEVVWVDLAQPVGSEAAKTRPAIVVSNDTANAVASRLGRGVVTIVPLTSRTDRLLNPHLVAQAGLGGLSADSGVQVEQIRSVDISRLRGTDRAVSAEFLEEVGQAIRVHLDLW